MRYGLLALSLAMLTGGGVAAASALTISHSAHAAIPAEPRVDLAGAGGSYGSIHYTAARSLALR